MGEPEAPTTDTEEASAATRGRPRPGNTVERDAKVLAHLEANPAGKTRKELVAELETPGNEVYLSLYRLSRADKIVKNGGTWSVAGATAPAETEVPAV